MSDQPNTTDDIIPVTVHHHDRSHCEKCGAELELILVCQSGEDAYSMLFCQECEDEK